MDQYLTEGVGEIPIHLFDVDHYYNRLRIMSVISLCVTFALKYGIIYGTYNE